MRVGFLGLGMVAHVFGSALAVSGSVSELWGFDVRYPQQKELFSQRFAGLPIRFAASPQELAGHCDILFSTVTTEVAVDAAKEIAPYLSPELYFVDMNSMTPLRKQEIDQLLKHTCHFVEAAVLGAVGATGAGTKILLCGPDAPEMVRVLSAAGLNVQLFGTEIGHASMFKMVRSVFSKGVETVLVEMLQAAQKAGLYDAVWDDICDFMSQKPFRTIGENWVQTHAVAAVRRESEMAQVSQTLRDLGVEPLMAEAARSVFHRSTQQGISQAFEHGADSAEAVVRFLAKS